MAKTLLIRELQDRFHIREAMDDATVQSYRESIGELPAILVWHDEESGEWIILDGRHRYAARVQEGLDDVEAIVFEGSPAEAEAKAWTANLRHGLPLSKAEKRKARVAVVRLLYTRTDNWIATELGCSPHTIHSIREELEAQGEIPVIERPERKSGGTMPRNLGDGGYDDTEDDAPDEELPDWLGGNSEVVSPGHTTGNGVGDGNRRNDEPPDEPEEPASAAKKPKPSPAKEKQPVSDGKKPETSLRFAPAGEPVTANVVVYVNDEPCNIPVTIMFAKGSAVSGIPVEPDFKNILVIGEEAGKSLRLLWE